MPGSREIERNSAVRYTDEVIEGNTVRRVQTVPQIREKEIRRTQIEAVRERTLSMNLRYVFSKTSGILYTAAEEDGFAPDDTQGS